VTLNGAGPGNDGQLVAANRSITNADDRLFPVHVESDEFVRLAYANGLRDSSEVLETRRINRAWIASKANRSSGDARHGMRLVPHLFDNTDNRLDLAVGRISFHYDQHG